MLPGDSVEDLVYDSNRLGEKSFNIFWASEGLKALMNLSKKNPELLDEVKIIDSKSNEYTVDQFLKIIDRLEIRVQN